MIPEIISLKYVFLLMFLSDFMLEGEKESCSAEVILFILTFLDSSILLLNFVHLSAKIEQCSNDMFAVAAPIIGAGAIR